MGRKSKAALRKAAMARFRRENRKITSRQLYSEAKAEGLIDDRREWDRTDFQAAFPGIRLKEVDKFLKKVNPVIVRKKCATCGKTVYLEKGKSKGTVKCAGCRRKKKRKRKR